jgi:hypothetical protein
MTNNETFWFAILNPFALLYLWTPIMGLIMGLTWCVQKLLKTSEDTRMIVTAAVFYACFFGLLIWGSFQIEDLHDRYPVWGIIAFMAIGGGLSAAFGKGSGIIGSNGNFG